MTEASGVSRRDDAEEAFEHVSVLELTEEAAEFDQTPGERVIACGVNRNRHLRDDETESFVKIAEAVAIIELNQPITKAELEDWCNSEVGKLALAHWFDHTDPEEVAAP